MDGNELFSADFSEESLSHALPIIAHRLLSASDCIRRLWPKDRKQFFAIKWRLRE
ncbi:MAG: hypothetical protein Tsb009_20940 [Planctomycetaceae bacterium]